jgi:hypothetical protein
MDTDEQTVAPGAGERPRGSRGPVAVLAVGVGVALALAGFVAGRGTAPEAAAPARTPPPAAGALRGPARIDHGVPLGFARSREGAVAAAVNFAGVLTSQRLLDRTTYADAVRAMTAPESLEAQLKKATDYLDSLESSRKLIAKAQLGFSVAIRYSPFGYQVVSFDRDKATVKVWGSTVIGLEQEALPVEAWGTTTFDLRWVGGDWRIVDQKPETATTVPQSVQRPTPTIKGLTPELGGFQQALLYAVAAGQ